MTKIARSLKNVFWPGEDRANKPVYLQETGELLGYISEIKKDGAGNIEFYRVDCDGIELSFSSENIIKGEDGYIYRPIWLTQAERIIKKLETQEKVNPEIASHSSKALSREKLKRLFSRSDPELEETVQEAEEITRLLIEKRDELKDKKESIEQKIEKKAQKRMAGEESRRDFAESIVDLKRKVKIVKENLNKLKQLFMRLKESPLIDLDHLKNGMKKNTPAEDEGYMKERSKTAPGNAGSKKEDQSQKRELKEGERIKKVRIPKLEQEFEQKEVRLQQSYLSDLQERIKNINQDIKDLNKLAEEHEEDEKISDFIDKKLGNLKKEKKDLRDKINEVKNTKDSMEDTTAKQEKSDTQIEGVVEEKKTEPVEQHPDNSKSIGKMIARIGSLALIIGLIVLLILSLLQVF